MTSRVVYVPTADYKTFKENYPALGSWSWFVRECLHRFNDLHLDNVDEILNETVSGIKEEAHEGEVLDDTGYGSPLQSESSRLGERG